MPPKVYGARGGLRTVARLECPRCGGPMTPFRSIWACAACRSFRFDPRLDDHMRRLHDEFLYGPATHAADD